MKKIVLLAIATVLLVNFTYAGINPDEVKTKKIINVIQRELQYPSFAKDKQIDDFVFVSLGVNEQGKIDVKEIYSKNVELKAYVLQKLENIKIKNFKSDQIFDIKIVFKLE